MPKLRKIHFQAAKVYCGEVQLISFEIFEQNIVKTANFDKCMANFVKIINTLQFSSQAAKKCYVKYNQTCLEQKEQNMPKKGQF